MKTKISLAAAALGVVVLGIAAPMAAVAKSPATPEASGPAQPKRQCFWTRQVNNFAAADDDAVNVRVGVRDVYRMEIFGTCPEIDWTQSIALRSRSGSTICQGLDAEIIVPSTIGPQRCAVRNIRKLNEAEIAALPKKARP